MKIDKQQLTRKNSPPLTNMQQKEYICCLSFKTKKYEK